MRMPRIRMRPVLLLLSVSLAGCGHTQAQDRLKDLDRHISAQSWQNAAEAVDAIKGLRPVDVETCRAVARRCAYDIAGQIGDHNEYRDRYKWIARAMALLRIAAEQTDNDPRIMYDIGTTLSERIGHSQSSESRAFRRYFVVDEMKRLENLGAREVPQGDADNLRVALRCFQQVQRQLDVGDAAFRESFFNEVKPEEFYAQEAICKAHHAMALENEGIFGEQGRRYWELAWRSWQEHGNREIRTVEGQSVRLQEANGDYGFWMARCEFGTILDVLEARKQLYQASARYLAGDLEAAHRLFEAGFTKLIPELKRFPILMENDHFMTTLGRFASEYRTVRGSRKVTESPEFSAIDKMFDIEPEPVK